MAEPDGIDLGKTQIRTVTPRDLNHLGSTGTATGILVAVTSWAIAQGSMGLAVALGGLTVASQVYQWKKVSNLKKKTDPDADISLRAR